MDKLIIGKLEESYLERQLVMYLHFLPPYIFLNMLKSTVLKVLVPRYHQIATDTIRVKRLITLDQVAEVLNLPLAEGEFLNPLRPLQNLDEIQFSFLI